MLKEDLRAAKKILTSTKNMMKTRQSWIKKHGDNPALSKHKKITEELPRLIRKESDAELSVDTIKANMDANTKALKNWRRIRK